MPGQQDKEPIVIPKPTLDRLKLYHRLLNEIEQKYISSDEIAQRVGTNAEQVRKDLTYLKTTGKPKVGYDVAQLRQELEELFGVKKTTKVILVGAGHLGSALVNYPGFANYGIEIVAVFDNDPRKIGMFIGELSILPMKDLARVIKRFRVEIGIICVPKDSAQQVADILVSNGIKGIWNFAPVRLVVPDDVFVVDEDMSQSLLTLKHFLEMKKQKMQESQRG
ncbi:MAG TPA: redox-sensing transcriptional repressor Rex [Pseudothermotoga sp.]|nr:redox-sensing transcriptional repressor Rex [Pseudothermotoga sp.]HPP70564.1 redox-sensing transcriptional repressor Rex [Pseudothermotoga sp.]